MFWQPAAPAERRIPIANPSTAPLAAGCVVAIRSVGWSNWTESTWSPRCPVWFPDRPPSRRGSVGACLLDIRFASLSSLYGVARWKRLPRRQQYRRVKRWREGDHRQRWAGSALLLAESKFRRVRGYKDIPALLTTLADQGIRKGLAMKTRTA
jgi:hypothetical protein